MLAGGQSLRQIISSRPLLCTSTNRSRPAKAPRILAYSKKSASINGNGAQPARELATQLIKDHLQRLGKGILGLAATAALLLGSLPADAHDTLTFPVAQSPDLFAVQKTLVEAWTIVSETYVDPSYNHLDWERELSAGLNTIAQAPSPRQAAKQIEGMVGKLGDPFTRWVPPEEYQQFRVSSEGELKGGVGLLIASDPTSGRLLVLAPIKGSPADRAGIQPGDEVITVNGTNVATWDGEEAAKVLRGEQGSSVTVEVARRRPVEAIPGVAGLREISDDSRVEHKQFRLRRERVELSPVFATAMHYDDRTFGYVRLVNFSQHAADDMHRAIQQLERDGAEAFILDLRNNGGGLVTSSLEIASLWMDGAARPTIFSVEDRSSGNIVASSDAPRLAGPMDDVALQRVVLNGGQAATQLPLIVLVNRHSASASEILAGALHDNYRAEIIGDRTFGKGKIQSVYELDDGSALFVTVAKYRTPSGADIDRVGILPDRSCSTAAPGGPASVPGIPVGPGADAQVIDELETDDCVLTAEAVLDAKVGGGGGVPRA